MNPGGVAFVSFSASVFITILIMGFTLIFSLKAEDIGWNLRVTYAKTYSKYPPRGYTIQNFLFKWTAIREAKKIAAEDSSESTCAVYKDTRTVVLTIKRPKNTVPHGKVIW